MYFQASTSALASNAQELEELNRKLACSEEDIDLLRKQMDKAQGRANTSAQINIAGGAR